MAERLGRFGEQDPAPRDRAIGALVWLHLANGSASPPELLEVTAFAEDFLWEMACRDALYGLPEWIATTLTAEPEGAPRELQRALRDIEASVSEGQLPTAGRVMRRLVTSDGEVLSLLEDLDPKRRDEGWRSVRTDVPTVIRRHDDRAAGLLLGIYVDVGDPGQERPVLQIGEPQTMAKDFLTGVEDGQRAALALLERLGMDGVQLSKLRHIVVRGLGLREPPEGESAPLRGRSAGLPVALTLLRRASELDGEELPLPSHAATGCLTPSGRLEPMACETKELKLDAVRVDGWFEGLLCPPSAGVGPDVELCGLCRVGTLEAAAEVIWGERWRSWSESLYRRSEPRKRLLEAVAGSFWRRLASKPSNAIEPVRVLRETIHAKSERPIADAPTEAREAMGSRASAEGEALDERSNDPSAPPLPTTEADRWESWEPFGGRRGDGDPGAARPDRRAAWERTWDPFGADEHLAVLIGGSSEDRARLLEHHVEVWLQESYRADAVKVPLLLEAPQLGLELGEGKDLPNALAAILAVDLRHPVGQYLRNAFDQGRLIVGLEGWELLGEEAALTLKAALARLVERGSSLVVSCQVPEAAAVGAVFSGRHTRNRLQALSSEQVEAEVRSSLEGRAEPFLALMRRDSRLADLAKTPALLRLLCRAVNDLKHPTEVRFALLLEAVLRFALPEDGSDLGAFVEAIAMLTNDDEGPARVSRKALSEALLQHGCEGLGRSGEAGCDRLVDRLVSSAVLVEEEDADGAIVLCFGHPVLQTASVAIHLAKLPREERWRALENDERRRHQKELLLELCCGVAADPEEIVGRLVEDPVDPWGVKAVRAARGLRAAARARGQIVQTVVSRLSEALCEERPLAERRFAADALGDLVEAGFADAVEAASRAINDPELQHPVTSRLAVGLNRSGDRRGLVKLTDMAQGREIGPAAAAFDALGEQDSSGALLLLEGMLVSRRCNPRLPLRTSALAAADRGSLSRLADLLHEPRATIRARQALAGALAAIPAGQGIALAAASDRRVPWSVRAAAATRLAAEFPLPPSLASLVHSPNLTWEWRARLLTAMLRSGDTSALEEISGVLQLPLPREDSSALTRAAAATPGGKKRLMAHAGAPDPNWALHTDILVALVGSGDREAATIAGDLLGDELLGVGERIRLVEALADQDEPAWTPAACELLERTGLDWGQRIRLAILLADEKALSEGSMRDLLTSEGEAVSLAGCAELIRSYWTARRSCGPLADMVADDSLSLALRAALAAAYCWAARDCSEMPICDGVLELLADERLERWHKGMLATALARSGRPEHQLAALEASLDAGLVELRVYRGLIREIMLDPRSPELGEKLGTRLHAALAQPPEERLRISADAKRALEHRVGAKVALCAPAEDTRLFDRHIDEGDEELSVEILDRMVPYYQAIVHGEHARLLEEREQAAPREDSKPELPTAEESLPPLDIDRFKTWSKVLTHRARSREGSRAFLSDSGPASMELEAWLESNRPEWPAEAAHRYLLGRVRREGIDPTYGGMKETHLEQALRNRLEVGDGRGVLDIAGLLALFSEPEEGEAARGKDAPVFFYASLGAAMHGASELAIELIERCSWLLSEIEPGQRANMARQGVATIGEVETLHGLDDDNCMRTLRSRLQAVASST